MYNTQKMSLHLCLQGSLMILFTHHFQKGIINAANSGAKKYLSLLCMKRHTRAEYAL